MTTSNLNNMSAPGILNMKCMIWEPNPINQRTSQDYTVVYNATTIQNMPITIQRQLQHFDEAPYGIYLRQKYVYRDTFLRIGDEFLQANRVDMKAENNDNLFSSTTNSTTGSTTYTPNYPYIYQQSFRLNGSLYNTNVVTPTGISQAKTDAVDNGLSKWRYDERLVPFEHDGHKHGTNNDTSNEHDYISALGQNGMQTCDNGFEDALKAYAGTDLATTDINYILARKVRRLHPLQIATSSEQKGRTGNTNDTAKPIHWLCLKDTPLYNCEDFFVEFIRYAYQHDTVTSSLNMLSNFAPLDARLQNTATNKPIVNAGVVDQLSDGSISQESINTYDLNNQPYYLIEIGVNDPDHHYFLIFPYNSYPICVQVGQFNVQMPGNNNQPPTVVKPDNDVSRRLSTYSEVSCKQLMDNETLRVTVRCHLGKLIVTFNGYEGNPWVITRTDISGPMRSASSSSSGSVQACGPTLTNIDEENVAIQIPSKQIQIGAGNIKCGFMFAPLHYQPEVAFVIPDAITVKGPVVDADVNLELGERGQTVVVTSNNSKSSQQKWRYFQDAENYKETYSGDTTEVKKTDTDFLWPIKCGVWPPVQGEYTKDTSAAATYSLNSDLRNSQGVKISYIGILPATDHPFLGNNPNPGATSQQTTTTDNSNTGTCQTSSSSSGIPGAGTYLKWFNAEYILSSGDGEIPAITAVIGNNSTSNSASPYWRLWNSITPVATGWRMYVGPNDVGTDQDPQDAAQYVETFSHNWSYSDNAKIEHTGNIRFRVNAGTATSIANSTGAPVSTGGETITNQNGETVYSANQNVKKATPAFLLSLADKTFFIRVYAWWSGGYMDCYNSLCPCRKPGGANYTSPLTQIPPDTPHCIFTGLAHGGEITVEGNTRFMDCQLLDYMKIMQDQYFLNSPFFDGMNDYYAIGLITQMAGFTDTPLGSDPYAPASGIDDAAAASLNAPNVEWTKQNPLTGDMMYFTLYTLPSSYDILQSPFMKFADASKYDEALSKIGNIAGKVAYFDRFGILRYDVRADSLFSSPMAQTARKPKCNFISSPHSLQSFGCGYLDLLALNQYTYKRGVESVVNDILLLTANPQGEVLIQSVLNLPGRYDATQPGYVGYTKRLLQIEGIFGSQDALQSIAAYYAGMVFKPPIVVNWEAMGVPHLQAMDIVTFTGLVDDLGFPPTNVENNSTTTPPPAPAVTLILTSISGEMNPREGSWRNKYEGEWLYGNVS